MRHWRLASIVLLSLAAADVQAQERAEAVGNDSRSGWIVELGGFEDLEPRFEGARHHAFGFHPIIDYRTVDSREWLNLPNDGFDFALIETQNFRTGPVANIRWERDVGSLVRGFRHVNSIDLSAETGVFAEWWPVDYVRTRVEVRDAVFGARGVVADVSADGVWHASQQLTWSAGPRLSLADSAFMQSYYSVNGQQSLTSGLPTYTAPAGLRSLGAGSMLKYKWTDGVATMLFVEYQRLATAAAESPLIDDHGSPDQLTVGLGLSYSFVWK